ncbi:hypothetical protein FA95DRAFT_1554541 [Auriscalpium vulgare]|uniref:Uncharacterized protein n=1 Tax=Auriscalpium vulgare TaxID=40419 RepID=A0ACB8S5L2_9AGAM|nr:hypothetical protein FA95DRAFT_1554541 [Auriscalpium vulgare]
MLSSALTVASLIAFATAFSDTLPVVAWSSHPSNALDSLATASSHSNSVYEQLLLNDDICAYDGVVMVDQPGLHASDLRTLSPTSALVSLLSRSPSSVQLPYIRRSPGAVAVHDLAGLVQQRCGSRVLTHTSGSGRMQVEDGKKHVVCVSVPELDGNASSRKAAMAEHESRLAQDLENLALAFPKHLVVFASSPSSFVMRRQTDLGPALVQAPGNSTLPEGGILKRYQLLTPALIMSLLVAFFVLIPIVLFGVSALASIQNPHRVPPPPDFDSFEKKD